MESAAREAARVLASRPRHKLPRVCVVCGREVMGTARRRYCSVRCQVAAFRRRLSVQTRDDVHFPTKVAIETLAAEQHVLPVTDFECLLGDFWPEDESAEAFIATVRDWRRRGG